MWSMVEDDPHAIHKNIYSAADVLYMAVRSSRSEVLFKSSVCLWIFCVDDLPIIENGILKSPYIIIEQLLL